MIQWKMYWKAALLLLAGGMAAACQENETGAEGITTEKGRRTVLVYMNARNSLYGNVYADSLELVAGAKNMDANDRLLLYVCKDSLSYLYRISAGGTKTLLQCSAEQNASDPRQLKMLLKWTGEQIPSDSYGLVLWSHSDGWLPSTNVSRTKSRGFGIDVGADGNPWSDRTPDGNLGVQMNITDLAQAVAESGVRPEFIFFDSCLMLGVEAAYDLRSVTDWVIGSPAQIPSVGAQYTEMVKTAFFSQPLNPQNFTEGYVQQASSNSEYGDMGVVLGAVRTDKLEALATCTRTMIEKYTNGNEPDMSGVLAYDRYKWQYFYRPEYYDLKQVMLHLITEEADRQTWTAALEACVQYPAATPYVNYWSNYSSDRLILTPGEFSAISAFVPQQRYSTNAVNCIYGDLNEAFAATEWAQASGWTENEYLKSLLQNEENAAETGEK